MANKYLTGNPLGSTSPKDLFDNASNFDDALNGPAPAWIDRTLKRRQSWEGLQNLFIDFMESFGFEATHLIYVDGVPLVVNRPTQLIDRAGSIYKVKLPATFPVNLTGTWATDELLLVDVGDASLRQDLTNDVDADKGAAMIGRSAVCVPSVFALLSADANELGQHLEVFSYHAGLGYGGGTWSWDATRAKSEHNGAYIISPTVPWDGAVATLGAFLAGTGETTPAGTGCWVKQDWRDIKLVDFGVVEGVGTDSSAAWQSAVRYAASKHKSLKFPDFLVRVDTMATVRGDIELFDTVKIEGTFGTSGTALGYVPGRCGSVLYGNGNSFLEIQFNFFSNENWHIKGVGFVDASQFPPGTPHANVAPVRILKGRVDGTNNRYITGNVFEDCAFNGYRAAAECYGLVPASFASNAYLMNYIGPTSFVRCDVSNCGDALVLYDCTMNHLWVSESTWFDMEGVGIKLVQTGGGTGGNVSVTFNGMVFEAMFGVMNTIGGLSGPGVPGAGERRNNLTMISCNREYTGLFGPTGGGGEYSGNPLGYVGHTDIQIIGTFTNGIAFGELTLPTLDLDSTVHSMSPATFVIGSGSKVLSPDTVNHYQVTFNVPALGSVTKILRGGASDIFLSDVNMFMGGGTFGFKKVRAGGVANASKYQETTGTANAALTFTVTSGASGDYASIQITSTSPSIVEVSADIVNYTGNGTLV